MGTTIHEDLALCDKCIRYKSSNRPPYGLLRITVPSSLPFANVAVDRCDMPLVDGFDGIMCYIDAATDKVIIWEDKKTFTAKQQAYNFWRNAFAPFGWPSTIS